MSGISQHATTNEQHSVKPDQIVPTDKLGKPISDEGNPAYLAGALEQAKEYLSRDRKINTFLKTRTMVIGHRTILDSRKAVPFAAGIISDLNKYGPDDPCPPTAARCLNRRTSRSAHA